MARLFCPHCGARLPGTPVNFCTSCGGSLTDPAAAGTSRAEGRDSRGPMNSPVPAARPVLPAVIWIIAGIAGILLVAAVVLPLVSHSASGIPASFENTPGAPSASPAVSPPAIIPPVTLTTEPVATHTSTPAPKTSAPVAVPSLTATRTTGSPGTPPPAPSYSFTTAVPTTLPVTPTLPPTTAPAITIVYTPLPNQGSSNPGAPVIDANALEARIHELINEQRQQQGLSSLSTDPALAGIARAHSYDMATMNFFDHVNPDGKDPAARGDAAGYPCRKDYGSYYTHGIAENLFQTNRFSSYTTVNGVITAYDWNTLETIAQTGVTGWMNSPGHRQNILTSTYDREGIGVAFARDDKIYVTENFC